jgi:hypothetical protein
MSHPNGLRKESSLATETTIYAVQVLTFALVAFFVSNLFQDEVALQKLMAERINDLSLKELFSTLASILIILGSLYALAEKTEIQFFNEVMPIVYKEFPRTIYLFGSSIGGSLLASAAYLITAGQGKAVDLRLGYSTMAMALMFIVVFFILGYALRSTSTKKSTSQKPASP